MSAIGDYVHYQYSHFTNSKSPEGNAAYLAKTFGHSKVKQQYKQSLKDLKSKLNTLYRQKIKINGDPMGEKEFFKLLNDLQNDGITKAANAMVSSLGTTNLGWADINEATRDIEKLQVVISRFSEILTQMTDGTFSKNPLPVLTYELLQGNTSIDKIKEVYRDAYLKNGSTFKVDESYKRAVSSHKNEINKMLANMSAIESILHGGMKNFSTGVQSEAINAFLYSTYNTINRIVGFISEDKLAELLPKYIIDELKNIDENIEVLVSAEGTSSSGIFNKATEDVSVRLNLSKMLKGQEDGEIIVKIPGITLKRTNIKNNVAHVNIKSNAVLSKFLDNAKISIPLQEFYNAYADYNMAIIKPGRKAKLPAELNKSASSAMKEMYNYFHAAFLPIALAGSLDKEDFAWFMVINNKVYNVAEIMEKVANEKDDQTFIDSDLEQHQYAIKTAHNSYYQKETDPNSNIEGMNRSQMIIRDIRNSKITMELYLNLNKVA